MLTLTTPINVRNVTKIHVAAVQMDDTLNTATVTCSVQGPGGVVYAVLPLAIRDGISQGLRATASPLGYNDVVEVFAASTPTGFSDLVTAYTGGINSRNKAAESSLLAAGLLPAGTVA